jgi:hypothetical protein
MNIRITLILVSLHGEDARHCLPYRQPLRNQSPASSVFSDLTTGS